VFGRKALLLPVERLPIAPGIQFDGREWLAKREFHVTLLNEERAKELGRRALSRAKSGLDLRVRLRDEYMRAVKGRAQSILRMCDVDAAAELYSRLGIDPPPLHVTLYTFGDGRGIGIASHAELAQRCSPLAGDALAEFLTKSSP
jgi:hypothetical protein